MRSHTYDFSWQDVLRLIAPLVIIVALFAAIMHGAKALNLLPRPRPTLDIDRTILIHQIDASRSRSDAQIVLIGDSSCLMDVHAAQLTEQLGQPILNLGTLSFLDLNDYALLLRQFTQTNPGALKTVVLLMHPEALRRLSGGTYHQLFFRTYLSHKDFVQPESIRDTVSHALGMEIFRGRVLARALPAPLPGRYGQRFGFSADLEEFLTRNRGSTVELDKPKFEGNAEYRLGSQLQRASRAFRTAVPAGTKLLVAITPAPAERVRSDYVATQRQML